MQVMSTKEEWLYRLVIKNVRLKPRDEGYIVDILLAGVPKDKYETKLVLRVIGDVQNKASEILETYEDLSLMDFNEVTKKLQIDLEKTFFG